ncbi:polyprotein of retroviral origin, putative, partial [Ixodes scapularis]
AVRHFRCYLYGRRFRVVTDCNYLRWLMTCQDPSSRLARWNLLLQEHDFQIVHRAGKQNQIADALSRAVVQKLSVPALDTDRVRVEQAKYVELKAILSKCREGAGGSSGEHYINREGVLCRGGPKTCTRPDSSRERVVVPLALKSELMRALHDAPYAGHLGYRKTLERLSGEFCWPRIKKDVREYCARCPSGALRKTTKGRKPAALQIIEELSQPFQRTSIDIMGPLA